MNYFQFRFKAVVDWIELEFRTSKYTNFYTVQRKLKTILCLPKNKRSRVEAQDKGAGGRATVFRFKIHDPKNWHQVTEIVRKLAKEHAFAEAPKVTAIEIALDAYNKDEATDELAEMVASYYGTMTHLVSTNRRLYKNYKGSGKAIPEHFSVLVRDIKEGYQIGIGNSTDERYQHAYLKTTDNGQSLPVNQHRARVEITLRGVKLPCQTLEDWERFKFPSLSQFFRFRQPKDDLDPLSQILIKRLNQIGERIEPGRKEPRTRRRKGGGTHLYNPATRSDLLLNDKARYALRNLSDRWCHAHKLDI